MLTRAANLARPLWARRERAVPTMILMAIPSITTSVIIWPVTKRRASSVLGVMSPNPTVEKTVTVKYSESLRVSGSLKLPGASRSRTK
jgi:hypothetical protein